MICPKCGSHTSDTAKYCYKCGTTIDINKKYDYKDRFNDHNKEHNEQYNYSQNYSYTETYGDEIYIKEYVGPSYTEIRKNNFNICALLLGPIYLAYRKTTNLLLLYLFIYISARILLKPIYVIFIEIIMNIYFALKFNELYMQRVTQKVDEIKQSNLDKTSIELKSICRKKGGISFSLAIIFIILSIVMNCFYLKANDKIIKEEYEENIEDNNDIYYNDKPKNYIK